MEFTILDLVTKKDGKLSRYEFDRALISKGGGWRRLQMADSRR